MPTHALLGATGSTGSAVLHYLLETQPMDLQLNVHVRNKAKLLSAFPGLEDAKRPEIRIYTGSLTDQKTLAECLRGAEVIYNCIADNRATRDMDIAQSAAAAIIDALEQLRKDGLVSEGIPTVLVNRTMSCNTTAENDTPRFMKWLVGFLLYYPYADIKKAELLYRHEAEQPRPLFNFILMDGPALHDSVNPKRTGHELVITRRLVGPGINYADFGAGWVEAATRKSELKNREVAVSPTGKVRTEYGVLFGYLLQGLLARFGLR